MERKRYTLDEGNIVVLAVHDFGEGVTLEVIETFRSLPGLRREVTGARLRVNSVGRPPIFLAPKRSTTEAAIADGDRVLSKYKLMAGRLQSVTS